MVSLEVMLPTVNPLVRNKHNFNDIILCYYVSWTCLGGRICFYSIAALNRLFILQCSILLFVTLLLTLITFLFPN